MDTLAGAGDGAVRRFDAGEGAQELHLPVALGAGDADDLAAAKLEVDRPEAASDQLRRPASSVSPGGASAIVGKAVSSGRPIIIATTSASDIVAAA